MKALLAVAAAALAISVGANAWQAVPSGPPAKPIWQQRVEQLFDSINSGDWKQACDAAPTAGYGLGDFFQIALLTGARSYKDMEPICRRIMQAAGTKLDGKTPVGITYKILYAEPSGDRATPANSERLVVVRLRWNMKNTPETTITFRVSLVRLMWGDKTAKCGPKQKPCTPLRWYVLSGS